MFIAELNVHSSFSDGHLSIPEIVDFYGSRGFGAIAITDTLCETETLLGKAAFYMNRTLTPAVFSLYMEILRSEAVRAKEQYNMVVLPGVELAKNIGMNRRSARILAISVSGYIDPNADLASLCETIREQGGVAVALGGNCLHSEKKEVFSSVDAWDASSGRRGRELAEAVLESGLPKVVAPRVLRPSEKPGWKTAFFCERNKAEILSAIRAQELAFTFYNSEESSEDARVWVDANGSGIGADRFESLRNRVIARTFPSGAYRIKTKAGSASAAFNSEAAQGH